MGATTGAVPAPATVRLGTNEHPYDWTSTVATSGAGGNWLSVTPTQGSFGGNFQSTLLRINGAALPNGNYAGTIRINAPGTDNTPQVIEVTLTVSGSGQAAPTFAITPGALEYEATRGSGRSASRTIQVFNAGGGTLNWSAATVTDNGGGWLSVNPASGVNTGNPIVTASPGTLSIGLYTGRLTFNAAGASNSPSIPVTFRVREPLPPAIVVTAFGLTFTASAGGPAPAPQQVVVTNGGEGTLAWRVAASTFNGGPWLVATPSGGEGVGAVTASVDVAGLQPGTYTGRLAFTADGATNSPTHVSVTLGIGRGQPVFTRTGVVNAATFQPTPLAPGEILSIFGSRLGPRDGVAFTLEPGARRLPETLAGTRVTFDGVAAPLFYVSDQQINLQVPFEVAIRNATRMVVAVEGLDPGEMLLEVNEAVPGIFTIDGSRAAALNQDSTLNGPDNPAAAGSVVQLFLTGQGLLDLVVRTGELAPTSAPFPAPRLDTAVTIDSLNARVLFAGLAPRFVGLLQVNAEVPRGVTASAQARVVVGLGVHQAVKPATIAVR